jgi:general secretion pathway protein F
VNRALSPRLLAQELSVLLDAGIPLLESLVTLQEKELRPDATRCLASLQAALRDGQPLSLAMVAQPQVFDAMFVAIVRANERSGSLAAALGEHARFLAWAEALRAKLVGALIYPALLLLAGGAVVLFLLLFVLPRFAGVFEAGTAELPWASRQLFALGLAGAQRPLLTILLAVSPLLLGLLAWRQGAGRASLMAAAWRLPALGPKLRLLALATTYRALGMLLAAGVPALQALQLVQGVIAAPLQPALQTATTQVSEGGRLSEALAEAGLCTPVAQRMLRVGERSGALAQMFDRAAAFHDEEIARLSDWVSQALNPMLMLLMGLLVGAIVVLMYLPIFQLVEQVQ